MWLHVIIILTLGAPPSPAFTTHMEDEMNRLFHATRIRVEVKASQPVNDLGAADEVLYVKVTGSCRAVPRLDPGRLAAVEFLDGDARPFITADCARIMSSIGPGPRLAVAMARVVAHETVHYLLNDNGHDGECGARSLFCPGMTARALTEPLVALSERDVELLRERVARTKGDTLDATLASATQ